MGKMKDMRIDIENMLGEYLTYEQITKNLVVTYGISADFALELIHVVILAWDTEERENEINFESKSNV
jgi:hypothetical protein